MCIILFGQVIENNEYCDVCRKDEKLLLCDFCPRSFHLECLDLKRAPRGDWRCIACCLEPKKYRQELKELRKRVLDKEAEEVNALYVILHLYPSTYLGCITSF